MNIIKCIYKAHFCGCHKRDAVCLRKGGSQRHIVTFEQFRTKDGGRTHFRLQLLSWSNNQWPVTCSITAGHRTSFIMALHHNNCCVQRQCLSSVAPWHWTVSDRRTESRCKRCDGRSRKDEIQRVAGVVSASSFPAVLWRLLAWAAGTSRRLSGLYKACSASWNVHMYLLTAAFKKNLRVRSPCSSDLQRLSFR